MIRDILAQHGPAFLLTFAALALVGIAVFFFPVTSLLVMGTLTLLTSAGLLVAAQAAIQPPNDPGVLAGAFLGIYALATAIGVTFTGLLLFAAAGAIWSLRPKSL